MTLPDVLASPAFAARLTLQAQREKQLAPLREAYEVAQKTAAKQLPGDIQAIAEADVVATGKAALEVYEALVAVDVEIAAEINSTTVNLEEPLPASELKKRLLTSGKWPKILALSQGVLPGSDADVLGAIAVVEAVNAELMLDFNGAVTAGLIAAEDLGPLVRSVPQWSVLLHRELDHGDIKNARAAV